MAPAAGGAAMALGLLVWLFFVFGAVLLGIGGTALWVWMIVDCATREPDEGNDKLVWILVIVFTHWVGALIYLRVRRPERQRLHGR